MKKKPSPYLLIAAALIFAGLGVKNLMTDRIYTAALDFAVMAWSLFILYGLWKAKRKVQ
jgi:hypothetical protein